MSDERKFYDSKGKFLGTFRPAKGGGDSGGGGCVGGLVAIAFLVYLVVEGWSGIVKPTYHFAPVDSVGTELLVKSMTFEKGRFVDADLVDGHFLVSVSNYDTVHFTGTWEEELRLTVDEHDFQYNTFKSGEEVVVQWDSDGVVIENKNPLSDQYGQVERWEGGMDDVQFWMALVLTVVALWFLKQFLHGLFF